MKDSIWHSLFSCSMLTVVNHLQTVAWACALSWKGSEFLRKKAITSVLQKVKVMHWYDKLSFLLLNVNRSKPSAECSLGLRFELERFWISEKEGYRKCSAKCQSFALIWQVFFLVSEWLGAETVIQARAKKKTITYLKVGFWSTH